MGQLKDMAARTLLLKLEALGWVRLPGVRRPSPTRSGQAPRFMGPALEQEPVVGALSEVVPLQVQEVSQAAGPEARRRAGSIRFFLALGMGRGGETPIEGCGPGRGEPVERSLRA